MLIISELYNKSGEYEKNEMVFKIAIAWSVLDAIK